MKIAHWTLTNGSGLHEMSRAVSEAEQRLGLTSVLVPEPHRAAWALAADADVHVCHVHLPDAAKRLFKRRPRTVYVAHGTPEHAFETSVAAGTSGTLFPGNPWMLKQYWLQHADARVTFWPRHQAILQTMVDRSTKVHLVPMGVDRAFWAPGESRGKYAGAPSLLTCESGHTIKWPLDLLLAWPWVARQSLEAVLFVLNIPLDQQPWWHTLANRNGAAFRAFLSSAKLSHPELRNAFRSVDYFIGLVRYGDHNTLSLQAAATGVPTISYRGNPYAHYWLPEGDQRRMGLALSRILRGETAPRVPTPVPDIAETARAMKTIYEEIA